MKSNLRLRIKIRLLESLLGRELLSKVPKVYSLVMHYPQ